MPEPAPSQPRSSVFRRSFSKSFPAAVRGKGALLWDSEGRQYLDFAGSAAVNLIGHGVREIADAMTEQARALEFVHTSQFTTPVAEECARELLEFAGENFHDGAVFFTCGGSEAVESALKLARQYQVEIGQQRRFQVLSRRQSYHGATLGALAVSGNARRRQIYLPMVREFEQISLPYCYRCQYDCNNCGKQYAAELERALASHKGEAAAFILEPVSGATLGAAVPPQGYLQEIAAICRRDGVLLIADEVMTGMGRTGRNFAVEHWGVAPDIMVTAKGMSSGYASLGAVIASARVVDAIANGSGNFTHGFTYNAHPVCVAVGLAVLRHIREQKLVQAASAQGAAGSVLKSALEGLRDLGAVGDVRGIGLLWGIEFVADKKSKKPFPMELNFASRVGQAAAARGLLVYPMQGCVDGYAGDHLLIAPPAVISPEQITWAAAQLRAAVEEVTAGITSAHVGPSSEK
ncbi:MAG TPA: aminotransferase class III-fold pyridoxal phosphate-dependent enzyme [Terriglobales bacterium]|nr:aminotransferase class III-fold pyridoxal phosphate-dependent enzyme [Terriglobales bacterium]